MGSPRDPGGAEAKISDVEKCLDSLQEIDKELLVASKLFEYQKQGKLVLETLLLTASGAAFKKGLEQKFAKLHDSEKKHTEQEIAKLKKELNNLQEAVKNLKDFSNKGQFLAEDGISALLSSVKLGFNFSRDIMESFGDIVRRKNQENKKNQAIHQEAKQIFEKLKNPPVLERVFQSEEKRYQSIESIFKEDERIELKVALYDYLKNQEKTGDEKAKPLAKQLLERIHDNVLKEKWGEIVSLLARGSNFVDAMSKIKGVWFIAKYEPLPEFITQENLILMVSADPRAAWGYFEKLDAVLSRLFSGETDKAVVEKIKEKCRNVSAIKKQDAYDFIIKLANKRNAPLSSVLSQEDLIEAVLCNPAMAKDFLKSQGVLEILFPKNDDDDIQVVIEKIQSAFRQRYSLVLREKNAKCLPGIIYLDNNDAGLRLKIIGLDGGEREQIIEWKNLPNFPKDAAKIVQLKDKFLPVLLERLSRDGFVPQPPDEFIVEAMRLKGKGNPREYAKSLFEKIKINEIDAESKSLMERADQLIKPPARVKSVKEVSELISAFRAQKIKIENSDREVVIPLVELEDCLVRLEKFLLIVIDRKKAQKEIQKQDILEKQPIVEVLIDRFVKKFDTIPAGLEDLREKLWDILLSYVDSIPKQYKDTSDIDAIFNLGRAFYRECQSYLLQSEIDIADLQEYFFNLAAALYYPIVAEFCVEDKVRAEEREITTKKDIISRFRDRDPFVSQDVSSIFAEIQYHRVRAAKVSAKIAPQSAADSIREHDRLVDKIKEFESDSSIKEWVSRRVAEIHKGKDRSPSVIDVISKQEAESAFLKLIAAFSDEKALVFFPSDFIDELYRSQDKIIDKLLQYDSKQQLDAAVSKICRNIKNLSGEEFELNIIYKFLGLQNPTVPQPKKTVQTTQPPATTPATPAAGEKFLGLLRSAFSSKPKKETGETPREPTVPAGEPDSVVEPAKKPVSQPDIEGRIERPGFTTTKVPKGYRPSDLKISKKSEGLIVTRPPRLPIRTLPSRPVATVPVAAAAAPAALPTTAVVKPPVVKPPDKKQSVPFPAMPRITEESREGKRSVAPEPHHDHSTFFHPKTTAVVPSIEFSRTVYQNYNDLPSEVQSCLEGKSPTVGAAQVTIQPEGDKTTNPLSGEQCAVVVLGRDSGDIKNGSYVVESSKNGCHVTPLYWPKKGAFEERLTLAYAQYLELSSQGGPKTMYIWKDTPQEDAEVYIALFEALRLSYTNETSYLFHPDLLAVAVNQAKEVISRSVKVNDEVRSGERLTTGYRHQ